MYCFYHIFTYQSFGRLCRSFVHPLHILKVVERGKLVLAHTVDLTVILVDVPNDLFSPRAQHLLRDVEEGLLAILEHPEPLQIRLKAKFSAIPQAV